jgi:hypothetical protein
MALSTSPSALSAAPSWELLWFFTFNLCKPGRKGKGVRRKRRKRKGGEEGGEKNKKNEEERGEIIGKNWRWKKESRW